MLTKLRSQSDETKTKIAIVGAIVVTAGIIAVWIMALPKTLAIPAEGEVSDEVKAPSPLRALIESISQITKSVKKTDESSLETEPEVSTSGDVSEHTAYDESNPAPGDTYAGEQVFLEE